MKRVSIVINFQTFPVKDQEPMSFATGIRRILFYPAIRYSVLTFSFNIQAKQC